MKLLLLWVSLLPVLVFANAEVKGVRSWLAPDNTRLVFDLSGPVEHRLFTLSNPDRIVIDVSDTRLQTDFDQLSLDESPIDAIRYSHSEGTLRIVLDLKDQVRLRPKSFDLPPNDQYGHRLVVDLENQAVAAVSAPVVSATPPADGQGQLRDIVIAIDAGHGGEDPGAVGGNGTREKDIVLAIALALKRVVDAQQGYKAVMIRDGDYFVSLRNRSLRARQANADLFISIHADGWKTPRARGASVWVLSERGASSEMGRWLASRENSSDLIGGVGSVSLEDKDEVLASVLLDMSMTASRTGSREVAGIIHSNLEQFARMHKSNVEMANFAVLRSPDVPSILVETGFITNPQEEAQLRTAAYQQRMAQAIFQGVNNYFWQKPPDMTWIAWHKRQGGTSLASVDRTHRVQPGDTLSVIAVRNGVSVTALREANQINGDRIRIGQVLRIPAG
ncbi:AMIN domain-containing protein [Nitrincola iocasae]|uniref:N-acetylmuramoyl-L-alanine amidase AmiC n=1 Tax=Nitrincola iocasae TaxID=2614693 RepID=A0A5J6LL31_9GAMM|nr:AMIN domain-containing protein [Nitrincola iocasae]